MTAEPTLRPQSLVERAAEIQDFDAYFRSSAPEERAPPEPQAAPAAAAPEPQPEPRRFVPTGAVQPVDRARLRKGGYILPDAPAGALAEELRIVKRQLLLGVKGDAIPADKRQFILMASAGSGEGKTFCAINLALSLAGEKDTEVLLVDSDFIKPEITTRLGLEADAGLVDALADGSDPESLVIHTDVPGLSVLPAGRQSLDVTELLASERTRKVLHQLAAANPRRVIIMDSPPALLASPASVLATYAGQLVLVVRADETRESDLREAAALLSGCDSLNLLLNGAAFTTTGKRFGSYYGIGQ